MKRLLSFFHRSRVTAELDEEMAAHIEEAIARGRSAEDARRAFGSTLRHREGSLDIKLLPWLEAIASDAVFGWRQLKRNRATTAAAVLSLALAIGATTAAFRLVDAVLLRPLPVHEPDGLFFLANTFIDRDGRPDYRDDFDYPTFRRYRETVADRADLMVAGGAHRQDVTFGSREGTEKLYRQFFSGNVFGAFGMQPSLGRLLTPNDDQTPGAHPVAVLSYDYWTRRFARDPQAIGKTFRLGNFQYEIVGVAPKDFTGTEPGVVTSVFLPATMNVDALNSPGWSWFRIWVRPKPGVSLDQVRQPLQAALMNEHRERIKNFRSDTPKQTIDAYLKEQILLYPAASGASNMQRDFRRPLLILAVLVALVLLIACANVANLLTAQATARAREMALRVSIGAGRLRLIQLVLVESALMAAIASALGALLAWWCAPFVVSMLAPPEDPVRLMLDTGWRALAFGIALTVVVTILFGLAPALRASAVKPNNALKGGDDPHARGRLMNALVAAQVAFCVLVLFMAGLFVTTFERLSNRPLGFSHQRVIAMETLTAGQKEAPEVWMRVVDRLRQTPGVEAAALSGWALLTDNRWTCSVRVAGRAIDPRPPYCLDVSTGFFETMRISMVGGRDFRPGDRPPGLTGPNQPVAGVGIVNEAFARKYFDGRNPVGRVVDVLQGKTAVAPLEIVGYVRDAAYGSVREAMHPTIYVPSQSRNGATFMIRTAGDPLAMAPVLRREISGARADFHVRNIEAESALVRHHMIRERLLATLSLFFGIVALVLAGTGLYGVLNYSVIQQRREIGIRMALGARPVDVVNRIATEVFAMVCVGLGIGLALGLGSERFVATLLFEVKARDAGAMASPILELAVAAMLVAVPPVIRAVRIDPAETLRRE